MPVFDQQAAPTAKQQTHMPISTYLFLFSDLLVYVNLTSSTLPTVENETFYPLRQLGSTLCEAVLL